MTANTTQQEIEILKRRLESLTEQGEDEVRRKLAQARQVVSDLEQQLSELTGRPSASEIKALITAKPARTRRPSISDDELRTQILTALAMGGPLGINAKQIATAVNQMPARVRQFFSENPNAVKRTGNGPGTRFFLP